MSSFPFRKVARRIVLTGGPGAGKTAILELARHNLCRHVEVLPESASIVFGGGFPRLSSIVARRCAQRAIFHVQSELETMSLSDPEHEVVLCDRGTLDALAYWPAPWADFFADMKTSMEAELARYETVVHLCVPEIPSEYKQTPLREESHAEARAIDAKLREVWSTHPHRIIINGEENFMDKANRALDVIRAEVRAHPCDDHGE